MTVKKREIIKHTLCELSNERGDCAYYSYDTLIGYTRKVNNHKVTRYITEESYSRTTVTHKNRLLGSELSGATVVSQTTLEKLATDSGLFV